MIGTPTPEQRSYNNTSCFGWAGGEQVYKAGIHVNGEGGWTTFAQGETIIFRYQNNKLVMYRAKKNKVFIMNGVTIGTPYIHINFHVRETEISLSPTTPEERQDLISKLA